MHNLIVHDEPADKGRPYSEFLYDFLLLTQRAQALACDVINDPVKGRLAELQKLNRVIDSAWRRFRRYLRDQISLDELTATTRRERLRLIPNELAREGSHD
jgi:hypothetical protein